MNTSLRHSRSTLIAVGLAVLSPFILLIPQPTLAQTPLPDAFNGGVSPGPVYALAVQPDGKILVGGTFTNLMGQPLRTNLARFHADGTLDSGFQTGTEGSSWAGDSSVGCLAVQADGKILVGGEFTTLGGQPRSHIGRLHADGTLDNEFNPGANWPLHCLAVQADGKILVGGRFTTLAGQSRNYLARLNPDGTLDGGFNPWTNGIVYCIAMQTDGKVLVGGTLGMMNGQPGVNVVRLHPDGTLDSSFNPVVVGMSAGTPRVHSLAVQADGKVLVGGYFTTLAGQTRNSLARLHPDGTLDEGFNPGAKSGALPAYIYSFAVQADGRVLVGGRFDALGGQTRRFIGRLNPDGTLDNEFDPVPNGRVRSLALQPDGRILLGGEFATVGGQTRYRLARLTNTEPATQILACDGATLTWLRGGTSPEIWRASFEASTNAVDWFSVGEGARIPGGWQFTGPSVPTNATIRARGIAASGYGNGSGWFMEAMSGLPFITRQPASRTNDAGTVATFSVSAVGTEPLGCQWFHEGIPLMDEINVAGTQTQTLTLNNVLRANAGAYCVVLSNNFGSVTSALARLTVNDPAVAIQPASQAVTNGDTTILTVEIAGTPPFMYQWRKNGVPLAGATGAALTLSNLHWTDGGHFDVIACGEWACVTSAVATVSVLPTLDGGFKPGDGGPVYSLAVQADGKVLVGGTFTSLGGGVRHRIGRLKADGTLDGGFNPGASNTVACLAIQPDGQILVGGTFTALGGQTRNRIARLSADGTLDTGFNPDAGSAVTSLAIQMDGRILVGGDFTTLGGQTRNRIARLNPDGTLDTGFNPGAGAGVICLAVQADGKILVGGTFTTLGGQTRNRIGRLSPEGTLDSAFNPGVNPGTGGSVYCLAVQADGKILLGGQFTTVGGQTRNNIVRLFADGTLDNEFNPGAGGPVYSLAVQADGKILVGGQFNILGGQTRHFLGRLNPDGAPDGDFNPAANATVFALALQADGKVLAGGGFSTLAGQPCPRIARLNNSLPAIQHLSYDGSAITWLRGNTSPEFWRASFEGSTNGVDWVVLGVGTRIPGGWRLVDVDFPPTATIRARGYITSGGFYSSSASLVETVSPQSRPWIVTQDASLECSTNGFGFDFAGCAGSTVWVEGSTDLGNWFPLQMYLLGNGPLRFTDPDTTNCPARFYRLRLAP